MKIDARTTRIETAAEHPSESSSYQRRVRAVLMVRSGTSVDETAVALHVSPSSIQRWLRRAEKLGMEGLAGPEAGGRPSMLTAEQVANLQNDLRQMPAHFGYTREQWSGALIARHLRDSYRIEITDRQGRRLLRKLFLKNTGWKPVAQKKPSSRPLTESVSCPALPSPPGFIGTERRARPAWDGLNKEIALRRINRLSSSGLPLEPFVQTLFKLINDGVPNAPNRPFLVGSGDNTGAYMGDTAEVYGIVPVHQQFYVHASSDLSGLSFRHTPEVYKFLLPKKPTWLLEEWMLPHFYRSEGYNEVFRKLGYHHMIFISFVEHGEPVGFYPVWRSADQPPFSREDIRFLHAIIPHVAHGLNAAKFLTSNCHSEGGVFTPLDRWGSGVVLMDTARRVIAADDWTRSRFGYLERVDTQIGAKASHSNVHQALDYISRVLNGIFKDESDMQAATPPPVVRLYSHWSGIVLRLRGVVAYGADGRRYFTVLVEQGELGEHRRQRIMYRWGLSPREFEIISALADNAGMTEMAHRMHLSPGTVKAYLQRLVDKLNLPGISALRTFARHELAS
ncbi:MAG TPA: helix-turn-helix domain-containing protein [Candidatus Binataceae bacterium]|nr:helix-turn-helix domain-containing protein [Candidatus Binataceae bacterium]